MTNDQPFPQFNMRLSAQISVTFIGLYNVYLKYYVKLSIQKVNGMQFMWLS